MAKRFTSTEKWDTEWFQQLKPKYKCLWQYLCDRCNFIGVWDENFALATFYVGEKITAADLKMFGEKLLKIGEKKYFIKSFIAFQYGKNLNPKSQVHNKIISLLKEIKYEGATLYDTLYTGCGKGGDTLHSTLPGRVKEEEEDKDKEEEVEEVKEVEEETTIYQAKIEKPKTDFQKFVDYLNQRTGKAFKYAESVKPKFNARIKDKYTLQDFFKAIDNAVEDDWQLKQNLIHLTPEYFTRVDQIEKWSNVTPPARAAPPMSESTKQTFEYLRQADELERLQKQQEQIEAKTG